MNPIKTAIASLLLCIGLVSAADYNNQFVNVVFNVNNTEFWAQLDNGVWCKINEDLVGTMTFDRMYATCMDAVVSGKKVSVKADDVNTNVSTLTITN